VPPLRLLRRLGDGQLAALERFVVGREDFGEVQFLQVSCWHMLHAAYTTCVQAIASHAQQPIHRWRKWHPAFGLLPSTPARSGYCVSCIFHKTGSDSSKGKWCRRLLWQAQFHPHFSRVSLA
jgi:hypothetical protein